jgi:CRP/FNR family transcriptional regulator
VLSRAPLFETLDDEGARALRAGVADVQLARGDRLFDEGDAGERLYVVLDGKIKLTRTASDGRENLLSVLGPGEMFGELSLFDPRPRTASAVAVTDSRLAELGHDYLRQWLTGRPDVAMHLLRALAQRLRRANDVMADLVFTDVPGRVAKALLDLRTGSGRSRRKGCRSITTSPRKSWRSWWAPHGRPSTRRSRISPPAAGSSCRRSRCSSWTRTAWPSGPAERCRPAGGFSS